MKKAHKLRVRYWICLSVVMLCFILLFANFYRTDSWTGDMPFSEFGKREWRLFYIFLAEELAIAAVLVVFAFLARKLYKKNEQYPTTVYRAPVQQGIKPGDYDFVWGNFDCSQRALILKQEDTYKLWVQKYNRHTGNWENIDGTSVYNSLEELKKALFDDFHFLCLENIAYQHENVQDSETEETPLFVNVYIRDEEFAKEVYSGIFARSVILLAMYVVVLILILFLGFEDIWEDWVYIALPTCGLVLYFLYRYCAKMLVKRDLESFGQLIQVTVLVRDSDISFRLSNGTKSYLQYKDIRRVRQSKKCIYLHSATNQMYPLKRASFAAGNAQDFLVFLRNKGVRVS